jgi:hypothetical protein
MRMQHATAAMIAAAAVGIAGCGSSSSGGGLDRAALASKLDSICTSSAAKVKGIAQPADLLTNHAAAGTYFKQVAAIYNSTLTSIKELKPASDVQADYTTVVTRLTTLSGLLDQIEAKAVAGDTSGLQLLTQIKPTTDALNTAAAKIGATACSD